MKLFRFLLSTSKRLVIFAVVVGVMSGACSASLIALIHTVSSSDIPVKTTWAWRFAVLLIAFTGSTFLSQYLLIRLFQKTIADLRMDLSRKIVFAPTRNLEEFGAFRLLAALTDDVISIGTALSRIPHLVIAIASLFGGLCYLAWLSWGALCVTSVFIGLAVLCYRLMWSSALGAMKSAREIEDRLFKHFRALTDGNKELKLHQDRCEVFLSQHLQPTIESFRDANTVARTSLAVAGNLTRFLLFLVLGIVIFVLPVLLTDITPKAVTGYVVIALYLMSSLVEVMQFAPRLGQARVALEKVESLGLSLTEPSHSVSSITRAGRSLTRLSFRQCLELVGVTHIYHREKEDRSFILGPINLRLEPGELVFLIGGNGSGKTTLAKIITGLYAPQAGEVRLDGNTITAENREAYRQLFSAVFSDFYLFEELLGLQVPDLDAQAQDYLVQFQLNHRVQVKDSVLSTTELSQGQRKRLALLTAYLEDRPIYLFDEWASDQDPLFKKTFYTQILPELKARGKTLLVISHDDQYFHLADRCVKMEEGKLK